MFSMKTYNTFIGLIPSTNIHPKALFERADMKAWPEVQESKALSINDSFNPLQPCQNGVFPNRSFFKCDK